MVKLAMPKSNFEDLALSVYNIHIYVLYYSFNLGVHLLYYSYLG